MKRALFFVLIFSHSVYAQVNLNQGLIAYYPFNGNANDQSGNNNNAVFNNATPVPDRMGVANSAVNYSNAEDLFLGKLNEPQLPFWFNGDMDEVRIYNRALNQSEVNAYGDCILSSCNTWLSLPFQPSYVNVGDLDIPGNQI